ncbi:MAG: response regulator [Bacteroides sp.]|nr:response regulator [Bacteroides sp.]
MINLSAQQGYMDMFGIEMTELAETQQLLRTVNHKLTMALEVANIVPWKWDLVRKTILCDVNKPLELSHSTGEGENQLSVPDREYFSRICKEDRPRIEQAYRNLIEKRVEKIKEEYRVLTYENGVRKIEWVEAQAAVDQQDENGQPISLIGSSLVITDRKKMESDLIAAKEKAEESNRLKSAFLANMSHEIRTPLNSIIGFSGILAATEDAEEKREYVSIIENNNTLLLQLINDILDISKIEAGTLEFIYSNIDLNEMMHEIEQATRLRITSDKVDLVFEKRLPDCFINTERNRITQVINNFLSNAIKFTNEGSIRFGYEMQGNNYLRFYVTDTGCGIPQDKIRSIFGRFVKLNNFKQGVGLGLSICETIISHMRGEIGVISKEGEGSTFWFTIPYRPVKISENQVKAYKQIKVQREELTILIAEDNQNSFRLLESILQNEYKILHAWNGQEAVELYKKHSPHLILMDISMPIMDGYEATKEIRSISDSVPILAITAYAYSADKERILRNGFDGYASKPLDATEIRYKIADMIRRQMIFI